MCYALPGVPELAEEDSDEQGQAGGSWGEALAGPRPVHEFPYAAWPYSFP